MAAGSRYAAGGAPRTPSSCLMSTMESSPSQLCLLRFNLKAARGEKNLREPQRAYCVLHPCSKRRSHAHVLPACVACAFQSFYLCFPEIQSLIAATRKIPKPSTRLTSGCVLIASSLSNTHKTVGQDSQRTCDVRPARCPGICVLSRALCCL